MVSSVCGTTSKRTLPYYVLYLSYFGLASVSLTFDFLYRNPIVSSLGPTLYERQVLELSWSPEGGWQTGIQADIQPENIMPPPKARVLQYSSYPPAWLPEIGVVEDIFPLESTEVFVKGSF